MTFLDLFFKVARTKGWSEERIERCRAKPNVAHLDQEIVAAPGLTKEQTAAVVEARLQSKSFSTDDVIGLN